MVYYAHFHTVAESSYPVYRTRALTKVMALAAPITARL